MHESLGTRQTKLISKSKRPWLQSQDVDSREVVGSSLTGSQSSCKSALMPSRKVFIPRKVRYVLVPKMAHFGVLPWHIQH